MDEHDIETTWGPDRTPTPEPQPVPQHLLMPPGVVITPPEQLDLSSPAHQIPYAKADRIPEPFQPLEQACAEFYGVDIQQLVAEAATQTEHGSVAIFSRQAERASTESVLHYVVSFDARTQRPRFISRYGREAALHVFAQRVAEMS